ncbi:MAG: hypothetical protein QFX40_01530 [Archaeoglobales archaeon]|nr:hypothetical protein [Archaeoglobales archaeon]
MSYVIYAAVGLLGLAVGLSILIFTSFGILKPKEGSNLDRGQAPWYLWVSGIAMLIASAYFAMHNDFLDAATFGGYGVFWTAIGTLFYWGGDSRTLGPIAIGYAVWSLALMFAYATVSATLFIVLLLLVLIFLSLIPAAWDKVNAKVLGTLELLCLIFTLIAVVGLIFAAVPELEGYAGIFIWPPLI